jgi:hypothetical protein
MFVVLIRKGGQETSGLSVNKKALCENWIYP